MFPDHQLRQDEQERLSLITENVPAMIAYLDAGWRYRYANLRYRVFYGGSEDCIVGRRMEDVLTPQTWEAVRTHVARALAGEATTYEGKRALHEGSERHVSVSLVPHRGDAGAVLGIYVLAIDVTTEHLAEEAVRESEAGLRHAEQMSGLAYLVAAADGRYERWSESLSRIHDVEPDRVPRTTRESLEMMHPDDRERFRATIIEAGRARRKTTLETRLMRGDGAIAYLRQTMEPLDGPDSSGRMRWFVTIQDVTEQKKAEERIRRLNRVYAVLSGINSAIIRIRDHTALFTEVCGIAVEEGEFTSAWIGTFDAEAREITLVASAGNSVKEGRFGVVPGAPGGEGLLARAALDAQLVWDNDLAAQPQVGYMRRNAPEARAAAALPFVLDGAVQAVMLLYSGALGAFGEDEVGLLREMAGDVSFALDHIAKTRQVEYLATYDQLTGLPNRTLFNDRLKQRIAAARQEEKVFSVMVLDLERLRNINETLGRQAGDDLLRQVGQRLQMTVEETDVLANIGGDRFAIATRRAGEAASLARLAEQVVVGALEQPFNIGGTSLHLAARAGIAVYPADGADAESLVRNAEAALRDAKRKGGRYQFYAAQMNAAAADMLRLESRLRGALERDEFVLHYQPKVDLDTGRIVGLEALIRWQDPEKGLVPPMQFVSLLEETGLILEVGAWAMRRAVRTVAALRARGLPPVRIAVNVSPIQLRQKDFVRSVEKAIAVAGDGPHGLDIEITESVIMHDIEANVHKLKALRSMDVEVAIDDFGTGYSSLAYIARLPVGVIKIDRAFIRNLEDGADNMSIVQTIISLTHALKRKVVAEGVETTEQAKMLRLLRCDQYQGFLFSKPAPVAEIERLLLSSPKP